MGESLPTQARKRHQPKAGRQIDSRPQRPSPLSGGSGCLVSGVGLLFIGFVWLFFDYRETAVQPIFMGIIGGFFWGWAIFVAFFSGLAYFAQFILPVTGQEGWIQGFGLLFDYQFGDTAGVKTPPELPQSFDRVRAGIVPSHLALAIIQGNSFRKAAGPGFVRLERYDRIAQLLDLRRQRHHDWVEAIARDGVPVSTEVSTEFHIRRPAPPHGDFPYPFDPESVFRLSYSHSVNNRESVVSWDKRISPQISANLRTEVSRYTFDQLYESNSSRPAPIIQMCRAVKQKFLQQFRQAFAYQRIEECPVVITDLDIRQFDPPPDVEAQRIRNWRTALQQQLQVQQQQQSPGPDIDPQISTQLELTATLLTDIERMRQEHNLPVSELALAHLCRAINQALENPAVAMQLSNELVVAWPQLQERLYPFGPSGVLP